MVQLEQLEELKQQVIQELGEHLNQRVNKLEMDQKWWFKCKFTELEQRLKKLEEKTRA
ncbi:hypothetical protein ASB1_18280 (plasmid) [Helicobacter heilmannii]|uniref:hypothetical protein n=1 Tax=Helicobacter heilmannii TaxID=35817 RepID=UPI0003DDF45A|nr:hypothetical protein [Helicobacter heilmannii]BDQ28152.1 hypothetical protein ASB1_18280 [Helicobacter heilmannii]CCM12431.1 hypothetical protein BN341_p20 [Helicobacter heilmannii ASB1.4]